MYELGKCTLYKDKEDEWEWKEIRLMFLFEISVQQN